MNASPMVSFELELPDLAAAQRVLRRRDRLYRFALIAAPITSGLFLLSYAYAGRLSEALSGTGLIPVLLPSTLVFLVPRLQRYSVGRALKDNPGFRNLTYTFDETGFQLETPQSSLRIAWQAVRSAEATEGLLLLRVNRQLAYFVPDRALPPGATREIIERLVDTHVSGGLRRAPASADAA